LHLTAALRREGDFAERFDDFKERILPDRAANLPVKGIRVENGKAQFMLETMSLTTVRNLD
jgi:hypothetical protein